MVLISLVCSNMATKISKIFETCKSFLPASEDFVNSATVFVNSATRRGRRAPPGGGSPRSPQTVLFSGAEKRTKRDIPPTKAFPRGKDATAPPRRSLHQGTPGHHSPGVACLNGALPHKKIPPHGVCGGIIVWVISYMFLNA